MPQLGVAHTDRMRIKLDRVDERMNVIIHVKVEVSRRAIVTLVTG